MFLWKRLQFMNMPIIYMKLRRELMKTEERNEFTVLNFGEFIPPYCLSLKEKIFLLTHISLTSLTVRSPHYNNDDYEKKLCCITKWYNYFVNLQYNTLPI